MDWVERIVLAVPSTMIASIVAWIAYQQYEINRQKSKLDLYDRRFKIYSGAIDLVRVACRTTHENHKEITEQIDKSVFEKLSEAFEENLNHANIEKSLRSFR